MKNYYEILEVNPKASKEIIEKAYKVLVEKYNPDLYNGEKQQYAERKTKEINEAYKILSNEFLKGQYDNELEKQEVTDRQKLYQKQNSTTPPLQQKKPKQKQEQKQNIGTIGSVIELTKQLIQDLAKSKERRKEIKEITQKDIFAIVLTIIVVSLIGVILWFIPFTNGWMREFLFENALFDWIGRLFTR